MFDADLMGNGRFSGFAFLGWWGNGRNYSVLLNKGTRCFVALDADLVRNGRNHPASLNKENSQSDVCVCDWCLLGNGRNSKIKVAKKEKTPLPGSFSEEKREKKRRRSFCLT